MTFSVAPSTLLRGPSIRTVAVAENWVHGIAAQPEHPPKGAMTPDEARLKDRLYVVQNGVALIAVEGLLVPDGGWIGYSGITGYADLQEQIGSAYADPSVKSIALWINSGGGYVEDLFEFCAWLAEFKSRDKLVCALCQHAYSAAYAIAASCSEITVAPMGGVGSIGVVMVHFEISKALEDFGVGVSVIRAPDGKFRGNMVEALDDAARAKFQASVSEMSNIFADHVGEQRGLTRDDILGFDAAVFELPSGTAEAVRLGLADEAISPGDALDKLIEFSTNATD